MAVRPFSSLNSLFLSLHFINEPFGQSVSRASRSPIYLAGRPARLMNWAETANFLAAKMKDSSTFPPPELPFLGPFNFNLPRSTLKK